MAIYIGNAFSINMIEFASSERVIRFEEIDLDRVKELLGYGFLSVVGHQTTSEIITALTEIQVPVNRSAIKLKDNDLLIVFQVGVRLEEGKILSTEELKSLPCKWYLVQVIA